MSDGNNFKTSLVALQDSKVENKQTSIPEAKSANVQIYNETSSDVFNPKNEFKGLNTNDLHRFEFLSYKGNAIINANDVKKENQIVVGKLLSSNNMNNGQNLTFIVSGGTTSVDAVASKIGKIGTISAKQISPTEIDLVLNVTSDKNLIGDVNVAYSFQQSLLVNSSMEDLNHFNGISSSKPYIETITTSGGHTYKLQYNMPVINELPVSSKADEVTHIGAVDGTVGYNINHAAELDNEINQSALPQDISNLNALPSNLHKENFHRVLQVTGDNLPKTAEKWDQPGAIDNYFAVVNAQGKVTDERLEIFSTNGNLKKQVLADNLTPQQTYDQTNQDSVGFSKQADGSWLICYNISPAKMSTDPQAIRDNVSKYSVLANIIDPAHKEQIVNNTVTYYQKLLDNNGFISDIRNGILYEKGADTSIVAHDVTPNRSDHVSGQGALIYATGDANGTLQSRISYQFVDDDNNGLAVGQPVTLTGKTGDVVNPHLSVPAGYELAPGQFLPGNYTLKDSNAPVLIHLKHKTGSAVVNTPASQTDEDTSSTPATKANDDSNKQNDQSNNNQQEQPKNDDQHQNKSKNNSDKIVLADKNNKDNSVDDSQTQKSSNADNQPRETVVKATKTASQSPTIVQSQLPQTDSNDNNSAAMLGTAALTGSFAAMFAMNKHRKED